MQSWIGQDLIGMVPGACQTFRREFRRRGQDGPASRAGYGCLASTPEASFF
jgi:hypothetical protein